MLLRAFEDTLDVRKLLDSIPSMVNRIAQTLVRQDYIE